MAETTRDESEVCDFIPGPAEREDQAETIGCSDCSCCEAEACEAFLCMDCPCHQPAERPAASLPSTPPEPPCLRTDVHDAHGFCAGREPARRWPSTTPEDPR